jgi:DMSO/TMAO reductase YedYZ heme-binding membrane subunit
MCWPSDGSGDVEIGPGELRAIPELRARAMTTSEVRLEDPRSIADSRPIELLGTAVGPRLAAVSAAGTRSTHRRLRLFGVWAFRGLLAIPFVLMAPEIISLIEGRPGAVANVSASTADVLGTSSFLLFVMMLAVTPINTMTGWHWHVILRRDYGIAMFFTAGTDLTLAALTTGDTFSGGPIGRIAGHTFLVFGTLSVFLLIPVTLTANRRAMHWLGGHWKAVQRLTYVLWVTILIHLAFLFGLSSFFLDALAMSVPLALTRVPAVRRWWRSGRRAHAHRNVRIGVAVALIGLFAVGYVPLVHELAVKGGAAFVQRPPSD